MNEAPYRAYVHAVRYDIYGKRIGDDELFEVDDGFSSVDGAKRRIVETKDDVVRASVDVDVVGPFTAVPCDVLARICACEYEDGELWDVEQVYEVVLAVHTRQVAEQIEDYALSLETSLPDSPEVEMSSAQRSFETFYVTWDPLDDRDFEEVEQSGATTPYCKVRVSTHDSSPNSHAESTAQVWLDEYNDTESLTEAVLSEYGKWREMVSKVINTRKQKARRSRDAARIDAREGRRVSDGRMMPRGRRHRAWTDRSDVVLTGMRRVFGGVRVLGYVKTNPGKKDFIVSVDGESFEVAIYPDRFHVPFEEVSERLGYERGSSLTIYNDDAVRCAVALCVDGAAREGARMARSRRRPNARKSSSAEERTIALCDAGDGSYIFQDGSRAIRVYYDDDWKWCWEESVGGRYVDGEAGFSGISSCIADMRKKTRCDVIVQRDSRKSRNSASNKMSRRFHANLSSIASKTKTWKIDGCYVSVILHDGYADVEIDGDEHSKSLSFNHMNFDYMTSDAKLMRQKTDIADGIISWIESCNGKEPISNGGYLEADDCASSIFNYFISFHADEIDRMQEDFINSPYNSWHEYENRSSNRKMMSKKCAINQAGIEYVRVNGTTTRFGETVAHGYVMLQDVPSLTFDASRYGDGFSINIWLENPTDIFGSDAGSIWSKRGIVDFYEIAEETGRDFGPDEPYYSIYDNDAVESAVLMLLNSVGLPDDESYDRYYELLDDEHVASRHHARTTHRTRRGRMSSKHSRKHSRRRMAWNDGFSFNGDSAWMEWYDSFHIDCDADKRRNGTWHVVYNLMDPLDPEGATVLKKLDDFDVDLSDAEYEEDALRDFMEDNVPGVPWSYADEYQLRDLVAYIMNEYGRNGTVKTRQDVVDAYMDAYGQNPGDDELDDIINCINNNYFVHISSKRRVNRTASGITRKYAWIRDIPSRFGGGWVETDKMDDGRWRARAVQCGEYATVPLYGRSERDAVQKAVKNLADRYHDANGLTVDDVMGRSASKRRPSKSKAASFGRIMPGKSTGRPRNARPVAKKSARARRIAAYGRNGRR